MKTEKIAVITDRYESFRFFVREKLDKELADKKIRIEDVKSLDIGARKLGYYFCRNIQDVRGVDFDNYITLQPHPRPRDYIEMLEYLKMRIGIKKGTYHAS